MGITLTRDRYSRISQHLYATDVNSYKYIRSLKLAVIIVQKSCKNISKTILTVRSINIYILLQNLVIIKEDSDNIILETILFWY